MQREAGAAAQEACAGLRSPLIAQHEPRALFFVAHKKNRERLQMAAAAPDRNRSFSIARAALLTRGFNQGTVTVWCSWWLS